MREKADAARRRFPTARLRSGARPRRARQPAGGRRGAARRPHPHGRARRRRPLCGSRGRAVGASRRDRRRFAATSTPPRPSTRWPRAESTSRESRPWAGPGLRTWLLYEGARRRDRPPARRPDPRRDVARLPTPFPSAWRSARAFHLAPMPFDVQQALVAALAAERRPPRLARSVRAPSAGHSRGVAGAAASRRRALPQRGRDGAPRTRCLARAHRGKARRRSCSSAERAGGTLFDATTDRLVPWKPRAAAVVDPTGAGDVFAAGVLAGWLRGESHERALESAGSWARASRSRTGGRRASSARRRTRRKPVGASGSDDDAAATGFRVSARDVAEALAAGQPVVALETTLVTHGLPHPEGLTVAAELETEVRAGGRRARHPRRARRPHRGRSHRRPSSSGWPRRRAWRS